MAIDKKLLKLIEEFRLRSGYIIEAKITRVQDGMPQREYQSKKVVNNKEWRIEVPLVFLAEQTLRDAAKAAMAETALAEAERKAKIREQKGE